MKTNDIKDIWKTGVEENTRSYSEEELSEMVVKSARKSIKAIYSGTIFRLVIVGVIVFLIATLFLIGKSIEWKLINIGALVILSISYFFWERSAYKMRKYTNGKPVKEWLEYRIKELDKSTKFNAKYNWVIYGCSILGAIGFYALYQIVADITPSILSIVVIPVGVLIYIWYRKRSQNRNYEKALNELKELYKQFEKSNE